MKALKMMQVAQMIERHSEKLNMGEWIGQANWSEDDRQKDQIELLETAREALQEDKHGCGTEMCYAGFAEAMFGHPSTFNGFKYYPEEIVKDMFELPNKMLFYQNMWPDAFEEAFNDRPDDDDDWTESDSENNALVMTAVVQYYIGTDGFQENYKAQKVPGITGFVTPAPTVEELCKRAGVSANYLGTFLNSPDDEEDDNDENESDLDMESDDEADGSIGW